MRKKLISFDRFHEQKNIEYIKLLNQAGTNRCKTATKKRFLNFHSKCFTETVEDTSRVSKAASKGQSHFLSTFLELHDKSYEQRNSTNPSHKEKRIDKNCDNKLKLAINPEYEEDIFENEYLRERLKIARIQQAKVKQIILSMHQQIEPLEGLNNSKAFKIRSKKFRFFGQPLKGRRKGSNLEQFVKNSADLESLEIPKTVKL